jgi:hypothetical protein
MEKFTQLLFDSRDTYCFFYIKNNLFLLHYSISHGRINLTKKFTRVTLIFTSHSIKMTDITEHIKEFKINFSVDGITGFRNNMSQQECIV